MVAMSVGKGISKLCRRTAGVNEVGQSIAARGFAGFAAQRLSAAKKPFC